MVGLGGAHLSGLFLSCTSCVLAPSSMVGFWVWNREEDVGMLGRSVHWTRPYNHESSRVAGAMLFHCRSLRGTQNECRLGEYFT